MIGCFKPPSYPKRVNMPLGTGLSPTHPRASQGYPLPRILGHQTTTRVKRNHPLSSLLTV